VADRLRLEVVTPIRLVVAETVDEVVVPGSDGYFGVLPGHAAFLTTLGTGEVIYRIDSDEYYLAVSGGFAEVRNDKVIVLADAAERPEEIDRGRAARAKERAERRIFGGSSEEAIDYARATAALDRALARHQTVSRGR
jgi:F-type H+-transporting ATPase subunit epsilon